MTGLQLTNDLAAKRNTNKLRAQVFAARARWEKSVLENLITKRTAQGKSERSPRKVLYIARSGTWWDEVKKEISALEAKIRNAGYVGSRKPRSLWLPTVIENSTKITLKTYQAVSSREISRPQAKSAALKAGLNKKLSKNKRYVRKSITGLSYKLKAYAMGLHLYSFTDWAVCICHDENSIPKLKRSPIKNRLIEHINRGAIGTYDNSALFAVRKNSRNRSD